MEQKFFNAIGDEQQEMSAEEFVQKLKRAELDRSESANGKTRDDLKGSYARRLSARLAKVKA
jgi:hypothetical protein